MERRTLEGGCHCRAVRYRIDGAVLGAGICHCGTCRRTSGAESVGWLTVGAADLVVTGPLATYASSPGIERGFCAACGTSLTYRRAPASIDVTLASLDDPEAVPPTDEWWLSERLTWNPANPALRGFARGGG